MIPFETPSHRAEFESDHIAAFRWLTRHLHWEQRLTELRGDSEPAVTPPARGTHVQPEHGRLAALEPRESVTKPQATHRGRAFVTVLPEASGSRDAG